MSKQHTPRRQGDILILPAGTPRFDGSRTPSSRPSEFKPVDRDERGRLVLAEGETTGHCHAILDDPVELFVQADLDEMADRFLEVAHDHAAELLHEEHGTVTIPPGEHIVRRKREYEPEAPRYVAD